MYTLLTYNVVLKKVYFFPLKRLKGLKHGSDVHHPMSQKLLIFEASLLRNAKIVFFLKKKLISWV